MRQKVLSPSAKGIAKAQVVTALPNEQADAIGGEGADPSHQDRVPTQENGPAPFSCVVFNGYEGGDAREVQ